MQNPPRAVHEKAWARIRRPPNRLAQQRRHQTTSKTRTSLRGPPPWQRPGPGHAHLEKVGGGFPPCWPRKGGKRSSARSPAWVRRLSLFFLGKALQRPCFGSG